MLPVVRRISHGRRNLYYLPQRLAISRPGELCATTVASSSGTIVSTRRLLSTDDRERQIAAELSRLPTPPPRQQYTGLRVNRSGILPTHMHHGKDNRPALQGLAQELKQMIILKGPITVAEYMMYALQHPTHGYYMRKKDKIGRDGDFVTAPEISQVG